MEGQEALPGGVVRRLWRSLTEPILVVTTELERLGWTYAWLTLGLVGGYMAAEVMRWPY